jgi:tRNA pseudouridine55 synthase
MDGVLVVDKPSGPTSHDVVRWARRALGTREVGHAGTLDPMATGVLVLGVGEGTKLLPFLMADEKEYETTLALGAETDTLDADGVIVERAPIAPLDREAVERAAASFVGCSVQRPPVFSAIKRGGVALYERVRRGEQVEAPEREVICRSIEVLRIEPDAIVLRVACGKGFYVRSLGRDLARALGTRGHLRALRRTRSGPFTVAAALPGAVLRAAYDGDLAARERVVGGLLPLARAVEGLGTLCVDARAARDLRHGRPTPAKKPARDPIAVLGPEGELVAIARWTEGQLEVVRGFRSDVSGQREGRVGA